ncbi:MAG: hypothetical protein ACXAAH_11575 [Promethearchaeota archaeon]
MLVSTVSYGKDTEKVYRFDKLFISLLKHVKELSIEYKGFTPIYEDMYYQIHSIDVTNIDALITTRGEIRDLELDLDYLDHVLNKVELDCEKLRNKYTKKYYNCVK